MGLEFVLCRRIDDYIGHGGSGVPPDVPSGTMVGMSPLFISHKEGYSVVAEHDWD